jgi:hypothetical protein
MSLVFLGADVVNFVEQNAVLLGKLAIFTAALRPLPDEFAPEFGHGSTGHASFLQRKTSLGVQEVDKFADAEEFLQRDSFLGRNGAAIVLLQELPNQLGSASIKL